MGRAREQLSNMQSDVQHGGAEPDRWWASGGQLRGAGQGARGGAGSDYDCGGGRAIRCGSLGAMHGLRRERRDP